MDEFIDTYSDDLITLHDSRRALLTHPLRAESKELSTASFCRLLLVFMIGSIEAMLESWLDRDSLHILEQYFAKGVTKNDDRIQSLREAFETNDIPVDTEVFNDYLAAKYLRNVIVHANWKKKKGKILQYQIDWIQERNFPTDTRKFSEQDLMRFEWVNENMMLYIAIAGITGSPRPRPDLDQVGVEPRPAPDLSGILSETDWAEAHWNNLERISDKVFTVIQKVVTSELYNWARGLTLEEINALSSKDKKKVFYSAAQKAAHDGCEELISLEKHAQDVVLSWRAYCSYSKALRGTDPSAITRALNTLTALHERRCYPKNGFMPLMTPDMPEDYATQLIEALLGDIGDINSMEVVEALAIGAAIKDAVRNIAPLSLFAIQLPIIARARSEEWFGIAYKLIDMMELGESWYSFVERRQLPDDAFLNFYREMIELLRTRG